MGKIQRLPQYNTGKQVHVATRQSYGRVEMSPFASHTIILSMHQWDSQDIAIMCMLIRCCDGEVMWRMSVACISWRIQRLSKLLIMVATTNSKLLASKIRSICRYLVLNSLLSSLLVSQLRDWDEGRGFIHRSVYSTAIAYLTWLALVACMTKWRIRHTHSQNSLYTPTMKSLSWQQRATDVCAPKWSGFIFEPRWAVKAVLSSPGKQKEIGYFFYIAGSGIPECFHGCVGAC